MLGRFQSGDEASANQTLQALTLIGLSIAGKSWWQPRQSRAGARHSESLAEPCSYIVFLGLGVLEPDQKGLAKSR